eukprot:scaffold57799_cov30-Tisochrysis_lutea.AAC.1
MGRFVAAEVAHPAGRASHWRGGAGLRARSPASGQGAHASRWRARALQRPRPAAAPRVSGAAAASCERRDQAGEMRLTRTSSIRGVRKGWWWEWWE